MSIRAMTMAGLFALSLAGCATRGPVATSPVLADPAAVAAARAQQATREAWLQAHAEWAFAGRVAVSAQGKGGNGRIDWRQRGDAYEVALSAPVTRQSWRLSGDLTSGAGRLEGLEGGPREGGDAEALLKQATGWDIPLNAMGRWSRGMAGTEAVPEPSEFAGDGRLRALREQGWRVDFLDWFPPEGQRPAMPRRIEASRDGAKVRLIVDQWQLDAP